MNRFFHQLCGLILFCALVCGPIAVLHTALRPGGGWERAAAAVSAERVAVAAGAMALCFLTVIFVLTGVRAGRKDRFLTFKHEGGATRLSVRGLTAFVAKQASDFEPLMSLRAAVEPGRDWIDVILDVRVKEGAQVQEVCRALQERVRERLKDQLGVVDVRNVKVNVREIM